MSKRDTPDGGRRGFLKGAAAAGGAAAVAVAGGAVARIESEAEAPGAEQEVRPQGYRLTPHIEEYYRLARR